MEKLNLTWERNLIKRAQQHSDNSELIDTFHSHVDSEQPRRKNDFFSSDIQSLPNSGLSAVKPEMEDPLTPNSTETWSRAVG